jgi:hypothetical protein
MVVYRARVQRPSRRNLVPHLNPQTMDQEMMDGGGGHDAKARAKAKARAERAAVTTTTKARAAAAEGGDDRSNDDA